MIDPARLTGLIACGLLLLDPAAQPTTQQHRSNPPFLSVCSSTGTLDGKGCPPPPGPPRPLLLRERQGFDPRPPDLQAVLVLRSTASRRPAESECGG